MRQAKFKMIPCLPPPREFLVAFLFSGPTNGENFALIARRGWRGKVTQPAEGWGSSLDVAYYARTHSVQAHAGWGWDMECK